MSVAPEAPHGSWGQLGWPDPTPGNVWDVSRVRKACADCAQLASEASARLQNIGVAGGSWEGRAAAGFHERLGALTPHLDRVHNSFDRAAAALSAYATSLPDLQARAAQLLPLALAADARRTAADPFSSQAVSLTVEGAAAIVALQQIKAAVDQLAAEHLAQVNRCLAGLHEAAVLGMRNDAWSWARRHLHDLTRTIRGGASDISDFATIAAVISLAVCPAAFPFLEGLAQAAAVVTIIADVSAVAEDMAYDTSMGEDLLHLGADTVFLKKQDWVEGRIQRSQKEVLGPSLQTADADRRFAQALADNDPAQAERILQEKSVYDDATQRAMDEAERKTQQYELLDRTSEAGKIGFERGYELGRKTADEREQEAAP